MVKINGNRVEPLEIEHVVRKLLGIEHPVAKAVNVNGRAFIVLYYLKSEKVPVLDDAAEAGRILSKRLTSYMIPTYYVGLDVFPTNANGKLSRKMLPVPDINEFRSTYVEPKNEAEAVFSSTMAEVLGLERVGIDEDFFLIGGDSLTAIRLITACAEEGYLITVNGLYECRTAEKLAARFGCSKLQSNAELQEANVKALQKPAELTAGQLFQLEMAVNQKAPQVITYHVAMVFGLRPEVDTDKLRAAAEKVIRNHPVFLSRFRRDEDGTVRQYYDESLFAPVEFVCMTDEEFAAKKPLLPQPMDPFGGRLYRCCIISTPSANYFFYDLHHLIADEMSSSLFVREVAETYFDSVYALPSDWLYLIQSSERISDASESSDTMRARLEEMMTKAGYTGRGILKADLSGPETGTGLFFVPDAFRRSEATSNRLFLTACAMAVARMNGESAALVYSNYHGRDDFLKNDSINCYVNPVPVFLDCREGRSTEEMMSDVRAQFDYGAAHCGCAHILENRDVLQNTVMFNYRNGTMNIGRFAKLCNEVYLCPKPANQPNCLVIAGIVGQPRSEDLGFYCTYPEGVYSEDAIRRFYACFTDAVHQLTGKEEL